MKLKKYCFASICMYIKYNSTEFYAYEQNTFNNYMENRQNGFK